MKLLSQAKVEETDGTFIATLGQLKGFPGSAAEILMTLDKTGGGVVSCWFVFRHRSHARKVAQAGDQVFPKHAIADYDASLEYPYDVPVLALGYDGALSFYGVEQSYPLKLVGKADSLFVTDIAFFFFAVARSIEGTFPHYLRFQRYGPRDDTRVVVPPSKNSVVSLVRCPECLSALTQYSAECERCFWSIAKRTSTLQRSESPYNFENSDT